MNYYAHVTAGIIDQGPMILPSAWKNISGLNLLSDIELQPLGWLPVTKATLLDLQTYGTPTITSTSITYPAVDMVLADAQVAKKAELDTACMIAIEAGFVWNTYTFQSDRVSLQNITGQAAWVSLGNVLPAGFSWRDVNNVDHAMTSADFTNFANTCLTFVNTQYRKCFTLKDQVTAATSVAAVRSIVW